MSARAGHLPPVHNINRQFSGERLDRDISPFKAPNDEEVFIIREK